MLSNGTPILAYVVAFTFVASRGYGAHALASADRALAFRNTGALSTSTSEAESVSSLWKEAAAQSTQSPPGGSAAAETETKEPALHQRSLCIRYEHIQMGICE